MAGARPPRRRPRRGRIAGLWRPRKSGKKFTVLLEPWEKRLDRKAVGAEAERLAAFRGTALTAVEYAD
nr:hypothetical protein GCM10025732_41360 [Glycomyces mayteni]